MSGATIYAYVRGDPISYNDPSGLFVPPPAPVAPALALALGTGLALGAAFGVGYGAGTLFYPHIAGPLGNGLDNLFGPGGTGGRAGGSGSGGSCGDDHCDKDYAYDMEQCGREYGEVKSAVFNSMYAACTAHAMRRYIACTHGAPDPGPYSPPFPKGPTRRN